MACLRDILPGVPIVESPFLTAMLEDLELSQEERRIALELHVRGFAVLDFPDVQLDERIERIKASLASRFDVDMAAPDKVKSSGRVQRVQDAWTFDEDVRAIATNQCILELLGKLYGRRAFPFQTLNFPVGTQQHLHSDSIHFSSLPERFMCGVWLALEDVHADAGPLTYLPGSHKWPILSNLMIGRRGFGTPPLHAQAPFEPAWDALVETSGVEQELFLAKKGQALIWAANLLHGGSVQHDPKLTRWSQVTHYYFEDCAYYTPAFSDEAIGALDLRSIVDIQTNEVRPNLHLGRPFRPFRQRKPSFAEKIRRRIKANVVPSDFDADAYYRLNPDVAAANIDAAVHYTKHGRSEGRRYRLP